MNHILRLLALAFLIPQLSLAANSDGYQAKYDVPYGTGIVRVDGKQSERSLLMDVYRPAEMKEGQAYPAVVLVHGGAFQRGGRRQPPFSEHGAVHSPMEDYARLLAPLGYVCFVIEYRLGKENPLPEMPLKAKGLMDFEVLINENFVTRINFSRRQIKLPALTTPADYRSLWETILSAIEDGDKAARYIHDNAKGFGVDPTRIAMGGHSAGGTITLNVAYGMGAPLKAVFPLSPAAIGFNFTQTMQTSELPPMLVTVSQNDMPGMILSAEGLLKLSNAFGIQSELGWVPGFPHFYPTEAISLGSDGTRMSVGERVIRFLDKNL